MLRADRENDRVADAISQANAANSGDELSRIGIADCKSSLPLQKVAHAPDKDRGVLGLIYHIAVKLCSLKLGQKGLVTTVVGLLH